jgi:hypothetical protein
VHAEFGRNRFAREAVGTPQNDPASLRHRVGHATSPNLPLQISALVQTQHQRSCRASGCIGHNSTLSSEDEPILQ